MSWLVEASTKTKPLTPNGKVEGADDGDKLGLADG
jgi:hypothetical protein